MMSGLKPSFGGFSSQKRNISVNKPEDPFVTLGMIAIELLCEKPFKECTKEDLLSAAKILVDWYLTPAWSKELLSIFPNSKYVNVSIKDKRGESLNFLSNLISGIIAPINNNSSLCQFCGDNSNEICYAKTVIPLAGSYHLSNFFPSFQQGIHACPRCVFAIQFSPLLCYKAGGKPCLISSGNILLLTEYGKEIIKGLKSRSASGEFNDKSKSGLFDDNFKSTENALFNLAYRFSSKYVIEGICSENESITLYYFDNYNQKPKGVQIFRFPSNVFSFISFVMNSPQYKKDWFTLLSRYYLQKIQKDDSIPIWKTSRNSIHTNLLENKSIIWAFKDDKNRKALVTWELVEEYCKKVRHMNQQRLNEIKKCADRIAKMIKQKNNKKRLNAIVSSKNLEEFRNQIRLSMVDWQKLGKEEPLIGFEQFTQILIPGDYRGWTEVKDLIVVRLYEQLHDILVNENEDKEIEIKKEEGN